MKTRYNNRTPNQTKFGARKQSSCSRKISMTRVSYGDDGQFVGTEQVEAEVRFDPKNGCYYLTIDDDAAFDEAGGGPQISCQDAERLMAASKAQKKRHA